MNDVKKAAADRAAHPSSIPAGGSFESDRKRAKAALTMQIDSLDSSQIHKIPSKTTQYLHFKGMKLHPNFVSKLGC